MRVGLSALSGFLGCLLLLAWSADADQYKVHWEYNQTVVTWDGTVLHADAVVPVPNTPGEKFPVIIFPNSWGMAEFEYIMETLQWGQNGYVMLEYETRGWYNSGGEIGTAGPEDIKDASSVLDYVLNQTSWNVDADKVAFAGVSYGAGISLLVAAQDTRIKTAIALSGWGNMLKALWPSESPSQVWAGLLVILAEFVGHVPAILPEMFEDLVLHKNITFVKEWATLRSPDHYIDLLNKRSVPVFISNNFEDRLFHPQDALDFYQQLQGPKMILLNQGLHATAEVGGLLGVKDNFVWQRVREWTDYFLKGVPTGILDQPPLQFQLRQKKASESHVEFKQWPSDNVKSVPLYLSPREHHVFGGLNEAPTTTAGNDTLHFSMLSGLNAGLPVVGEVFQVYADVPILADLPLVPREFAVVYEGKALGEETRVCGSPNVTLTLLPHKDHPNFQVIAYLYSVDLLGVGTLLAHGPYTHYSDSTAPATVTFPLRALCTDVTEGHHLALGLNMWDSLYTPASASPFLEVTVAITADSVLSVPVVQV